MPKKSIIEKIVYYSILVTAFAVIISGLVIDFFKIKKTMFLEKFMMLCMLLLFFFSGLYMIFGTIYKWNSFKTGFRRVDLEELIGTTTGRILYVIIGISLCLISIYLFYNKFIFNNL